MDFIPNFHVLKISFVGATDHKGARIKIRSDRFKQTVVISYNHEFSRSSDIAADYLSKNGFNIIGKAEGNANFDYLITDTFESIK